jgi:uncharacterized protein
LKDAPAARARKGLQIGFKWLKMEPAGSARFNPVLHDYCNPHEVSMQTPTEAVLLRVFIGESDRWRHQPLYEAIVLKARELHLAGATVLRGPMGFGKSSRVHTAKILRLSMDLPLVVEIVDAEEKINAFLPWLDEMMKGGLVTIEKVKVLHYRADPAAAVSPQI